MCPLPIPSHECPFCHRPFSAELVSKEKLDSSMVVPEPAEKIQIGRDLTSPLSRSEDWIGYKLTYRCKHCGKEWTRTSEKEVELPRSYVENEYKDADRTFED